MTFAKMKKKADTASSYFSSSSSSSSSTNSLYDHPNHHHHHPHDYLDDLQLRLDCTSSPYTCLVPRMAPRGQQNRMTYSELSHNSYHHHSDVQTMENKQTNLRTRGHLSPAISPVIQLRSPSSSRAVRGPQRRSATCFNTLRRPSQQLFGLLLMLLLHVILSPALLLCLAQSSHSSSSHSQHASQHHLSLPSASQYQMAPAGCEWRSRAASPHLFGNMVTGSSGGDHSTSTADQGASSATSNEMLLACKLRTLNGALDSGVNLSLIPPDRTFGLALNCEDVLFESMLPNRSFERLQQLRELHIDRCKLSELHADVFSGLSELRQLTVRTHNTDWGDQTLKMAPAVFVPVRRLEQLDLSENGLSLLPTPLFCPLPRLTFLNVSANVIGDVASFGFSAKAYEQAVATSGAGTLAGGLSECRRLDSISHLDASSNRIKVLTDRGFGRLHRLAILNLRHNLIVRAEETSLAGLGELARLDLSNNQLVALPARFFQAVKTTLAELYLQNNSISVIPPGLFSGLAQVTVLDLSHNEVTSHWIGPTTFADMSRLLSLDLSYNKLTRIDANAFRALYTLQSLSLQHNEIESLAENAFSANRNLHTLSLSGNRLTTLDAASFAGLEVLNALALDANRLLHIHPTSFANISSLMELNLGQNRLEVVPGALATLRMLRSLDLSYNHIREIGNASYIGLEQLYSLNMEGNQIGNLTRGDFIDLPSLRVLNLARNRIGHVESGTFEDIIDLHALRLDSNTLADVNGLFPGLRDLLMLNISANRIVHFDYAMIPMALQWLDIHENSIEQLSNFYSIESDVKLRTLDASSNRITDIEESSLPNSIELVLLNRNVIRKIAPGTFAKKTNLTRVDLSENRLSTLEMKSLQLTRVPERRPLPEFSIAGNPFLCDCQMEWLQRAALAAATASPQKAASPSSDEASRLYPRVVDAHLVQCRLPFGRIAAPALPSQASSTSSPSSSSHLTPLVNLRASQFLCSYRSHCFALCHCCDFDACDCEMTCPDNCTCFYDQSWNTNIVDCGANGHSVVPSRIPMDVTDLYLDGNNIAELSPHTFIGRKNLRHLYLNSSHIRAINNRTFNGLKSLLVLNLASNELDTLYGYEFERLGDLRELYLQDNRISVIGNRTFSALRSLRLLRLDHNHIVEFELWSGLMGNGHIVDLYLGANDWSCDCHFVSHMMEWLPLRSDVIRDLSLVHCQYNETYALPLAPIATTTADIEAARANISAACSAYPRRTTPGGVLSAAQTPLTGITGVSSMAGVNVPVVVLVVASTFAILLLLASVITAALYRHEMSVWVYAKTGIRLGGGAGSGGTGKGRRRRRGQHYGGANDTDERLFDAFLFYSKRDEQFVMQEIAPELEYGSTPMRLCLCYRDLPIATAAPGVVSDAIMEAIASSRRTILVVSDYFLRNEWCHVECKAAFMEGLRCHQDNHQLILLVVHPLQGKDVDADVRNWLRSKDTTCLQWNESMFWEKLRYAMPDIRRVSGSSGGSSSSSSTASSSYGRKGQPLSSGSGGKTGTLPGALSSLSPLAQSRSAIDSYGHHGHLQHMPPPPPSQLSAHHPLLSHGGGVSLHSSTLGRHNPYHYQQSQNSTSQHLYSPSSVHSQQSTYAYPTYHPHQQQSSATLHHHSLLGQTHHHSTPPPLPPAHPLHSQLHLQQQQQHQQHQQQLQHSFGGNNSASTTATSLESTGLSHLGHGGHHGVLSHGGHQRGGPNSSSNESSLMTNLGSAATTITTTGSDSDRSAGGGGGGGHGSLHHPFVPSASSTTAVAVHI